MMERFVEDSIGLLRDMVRTPSLSFEEKAVSDLIASRLGQWGISPLRIRNNILAFNTFYDSSKPTLALDAHIDTVPAAASYTRDPFDPGDGKDIVYGLGSNDDGGSVVSMIAAFRELKDRQMPINVALVLSCEEECSGKDGAIFLYGPDGPEQLSTVKWVIVGEPTELKAATCERGLLVLDALAKGVSGHAARCEGVNALYIALDDIQKLRDHKFDRHSDVSGDTRLNVTQINAGSAHNVIPDSCSFVVDVRFTELYTPAEILDELQGLCRSELSARNLNNRASASKNHSLLLKAAAELGMETFSSPTTSNWLRIGDRDAVKFGPGSSSRSHRADEFVFCSEIEQACAKYLKFVESVYGSFME